MTGPPRRELKSEWSKLAQANEDIMFDRANQIGLAVLAADGASQTGVIVAIVVASIGAAATFSVGLLNFLTQRRGFKSQLELIKSQVALMRSSQITERITNAINQLGSDSQRVRIGGIFALERIAGESKDDLPNIVSTLATFIRESQPAAAVQKQSYVPMLKIRAPDVHVALMVLGRSPLSDDRTDSSSTHLLDLSRTDLRRASLSGAHLERVNLWAARLEGANLRGAHLQGAVLSGAHLGRFDPKSERYQDGADLSDADLTGAQLDDVIDLHVAKTTDGTLGLPK